MPAGPQCSEEKIGDNILLTLYTQTHKMVKHTQTIRRQSVGQAGIVTIMLI